MSALISWVLWATTIVAVFRAYQVIDLPTRHAHTSADTTTKEN